MQVFGGRHIQRGVMSSYQECAIGLEQAQLEVGELEDWLVRACGPNPQARQLNQNPALKAAVHNLLQREEILERGDFLSTVMRLSQGWCNIVMEYIQGDRPYTNGDPGLKCTLRNVGTTAVRVQIGDRMVPRSYAGNKIVSAHDIFKMYKTISPGDEITLKPNWAVHALWDHGRYSRSVRLWQRMAPEEVEGRKLVEVGYTAEFMLESMHPQGLFQNEGDDDHSYVEIDSKKWQLAKIEEAYNAAMETKGNSNKRAILGVLKPWWPFDERTRKLISQLEEKVA
jgi:hypothetical protein